MCGIWYGNFLSVSHPQVEAAVTDMVFHLIDKHSIQAGSAMLFSKRLPRVDQAVQNVVPEREQLHLAAILRFFDSKLDWQPQDESEITFECVKAFAGESTRQRRWVA